MILVVGSINMDISLRVADIPRPGETVMSSRVTKSPGGKGANQAVAAAKLGGNVVMLGCVGEDTHGLALLQSMTEANIDTTHICKVPSVPTSSAFICVANSGENAIVVDSSANKCVTPEYLAKNEDLFCQAEYCILQMEIPIETVKYAKQLCQRYGVKIILNPSPLTDFDRELLSDIDYLIPNKEEAATLLGKPYDCVSDSEWGNFMTEYGIKNMIVTLGKSGAKAFSLGSEPHLFPAKPRNAADTTGAGDTFLGAFAASIFSGASISNAVCFANIASGISVTHYGAQSSIPTKSEVLEEYHLESSKQKEGTP